MAETVYGPAVNGHWRSYVTYNLVDSGSTVTLSGSCGFQSLSYGFQIHSFRAAIRFSGDPASIETYDTSFTSPSGQTVSKDLISHSRTYTKTTSPQQILIEGRITNNTGFENGDSYVSTYITIPAAGGGGGDSSTVHTVTYDANGGTGAPSPQQKVYGTILTLSSVKPTWTGHTFLSWNTAQNGSGRTYNPGDQYGEDEDVTLYAQWEVKTYTVKYNANGGTGAPASQTKTYGVTLYLSTKEPTRSGYTFLGWGINESTTRPSYYPGGPYSTNANVTLYAVWTVGYTPPRITNLTADRCTSTGALDDEGGYAKVAFKWETDNTVKSIKILCNSVTTNVSTSGTTSGSVSKVVGSGNLDSNTYYTITVTVSDDTSSTNASTTLATMHYILDFSPQGGIAIGEVAQDDQVFTVGVDSTFRNDISLISGNVTAESTLSLTSKLDAVLSAIGGLDASMVGGIEKQGITIGNNNLSQNLTSSDVIFTAASSTWSGTTANNTWSSSKKNTVIYKSGNYIIVRVPTFSNKAITCPVEVSAFVRADGIGSTNFAASIYVDHYSGGASFTAPFGGQIPLGIGTAGATTAEFMSLTASPFIVVLNGQSGSSTTYNEYRFSLKGRTSNAQGIVTMWYMTVKML